jgi:polyhydroxybutyrate depolymerase
MRILGLALLASVTFGAGAALACGADSDCLVEGGDYRAALPPEAGDKLGAIVFLHGSDGSPEDIMGFAALREVTDRLGVALIVPRGINGAWRLPEAYPGPRDDVAFIDRVVADAEARFPIDPDRIMIAGFSLGASMAWYVACAEGTRYAGYAAVAGAFWEPYVGGCVTPLPDLFHVHGLTDDVVPLDGLVLPDAIEGSTWESFALLRDFSGCAGALEPEPSEEDGLECSVQACGGASQEICLHPGGHGVDPRWIERAWRHLAALKGWN